MERRKDIDFMENLAIPLRYHCRNARLCLQKASFAKKAELATEELRHLRKFENIVLITLPAHPLYKKADEEVLELEDCLPDAKKRLKELEEVPHIKEPPEFVHISGSITTFNVSRTQQTLESKLANFDDAMLLQEPLAHLESMSKHSREGPTTNATAMPILLPTLPSTPSNKNVRSCMSLPGIISGNDKNSMSTPAAKTQIALFHSMNGLGNGENNGPSPKEKLLISCGPRKVTDKLFEPQERSSSEGKSVNDQAWPPVSTYFCVSKSNGDVPKVIEPIRQGMAGNGNAAHGSEQPALRCNEDEEDTESLYSSSTDTSPKRAFDSTYDDDTSCQDSQPCDDLLSVDSTFSDKGYEWHWVKPVVASELVETTPMNQLASDENKKKDGFIKPSDALIISADLQFATPNDAPFAASDAQEGDKARPLKKEYVEKMYEDLSPVVQLNAIPLKWSNIPVSHAVEGQSDYSDSTVEQKLPASPGQTTFCNPVFDFNPLEGSGLSSEVNMLQKLQEFWMPRSSG